MLVVGGELSLRAGAGFAVEQMGDVAIYRRRNLRSAAEIVSDSHRECAECGAEHGAGECERVVVESGVEAVGAAGAAE